MDNEYKLPYTATEFHERVILMDKLMNIDDTPTEGSNELITSGAVFDAIGDVKTVIESINNLIGT